MQTGIVTISFDATVAGMRLAVQGATIVNRVNDIPTIELQCAPSNAGSAKPLKPNVVSPSIDDFASLYAKLAEKADGLAETGTVKIELKGNKQGGKNKNESLTLTGWILTGVGMSNVSATSAPYLTVVLQHPICKLTKVGSVYETAKAKSDSTIDSMTENKKDFIKILEAVYEAVKNQVQYWPVQGENGSELPSAYRNMLGSSGYSPSEYLEFKNDGGEGRFLAGYVTDSGAKKLIAMATGRLVLPNAGNSSTWDVIVRAAGDLMLSVTQDKENNYYNKKLVLEPTKPWKACSVELNASDCFQTSIPGMDPFKISGVMVNKISLYEQGLSLGGWTVGKVPDKAKNMAQYFYAPVKPDIADGRIVVVAPPAIMVEVANLNSTYGSIKLSNGSSDLRTEFGDNFNRIMTGYAKAVYETSVASMRNGVAYMALRFGDNNGNPILPGNTCKFVIGSGKVLYYGYITSVVHNLSTNGGNSTVVSMSYVRSSPGYKVRGKTVIKAGSPSPAYAQT